MDNLSFDPVKVDTSLAEEYMREKCVVFEEPESGLAWDYENEVFVKINEINIEFNECSGLNQKLRNLSKRLEDNSELFSQLDYLLRKVDVDETRNCHLKLISQYLRFDEGAKEPRTARVILKANTPLYYLGHVATANRHLKKPVLVCEKTTAPICQLFYELCLDVELEIYCYCINSKDWDQFGDHFPLSQMGCTLAITEDADMDSAVDVFLNSSVQAPWRIERIYVQESVCDELMEVLEARCERVDSERCVAAFRTVRGRSVEVGAGAGAGAGAGCVPVRAYRGARDLLALLADDAGGSLSLWCGAAAAAQEIALAAPYNLVWIDDYAAFDGPPSASIPFYHVPVERYYILDSVNARLLELQRTWTALPEDERKAIVLDVLEKVSSGCEGPIIGKLVDGISGWTPADLVDITPNRITMVIDRPYTVLLFGYINMLEFLQLVIRGYRGVVNEIYDIDIIPELCSAGVPIIKTKLYLNKNSECTHEIRKSTYANRKVIHSRFGTIYSN